MAASGKTPIQFYRSTTSGNTPSASNLSPGELALNIADNDMTMYFENASGTVKRFFNNPAALKYPTADGTSGQVISTNASGVLSFADAGSSAITDNTRQAVTSSATTTINLASGQVIDLTMAANITSLSFTNVPASGTPILVQIVVKNASDGTAYTIAWPNSVYWSGQYSATTISTVQTAPTLASGANGVTTIALLTTDGGTKWRGWVEGTIAGGSQGSLYTWGQNLEGSLGLNDTPYRSSPVQVGSLSNWVKVACGYRSSFSIKTDGTLWAWGRNVDGQLGLGENTDRSSPVQVGSATNWASVTAGFGHAAAIKTNGSLYVTGQGGSGKLGLGSTTNVNAWTQVGSLTNWASVSAGEDQTVAVKTDGTLWAWGLNGGRLGLNNNISHSSPVQVGAGTSWRFASTGFNATAAIKSDNTLWVFGTNTAGQLGLNDTTSVSSPVQLGASSDWSTIKSGRARSLAIKTNGTLWGWGNGFWGALGLNSSDYRSSPVQVGALTNWASVDSNLSMANDFSSIASKTDGTLWVMGRNNNGQLGLNDLVARSSPVQVGSLTNWNGIAAGGFFKVTVAGTTSNPG